MCAWLPQVWTPVQPVMRTRRMSWNLQEGAVTLPGLGCCQAHPDSWSEIQKEILSDIFYIFMCVLVTSRSTVLFSIKVNCILNIVLLIACVFLCVNRQVGQSNRPTFRPGLEGGSSEDEASSGRGGASSSGIGHRRSAEGQVINPPVTGITPIFNVCCVCL